jgi:uncharacterized protein (TIGR00369 family)
LVAVRGNVSIGDFGISSFSKVQIMSYEAIRQQANSAVPFASYVGVELEKIEKGRAVARLPIRPQGLNHIGTQHAGALFTLGESASGAAMVGIFAPVLSEIRPVAAEAAIRYIAPAKGAVRAQASASGDADTLLAAIKTDGKTMFQVSVTMTDEDGTGVAEMTVNWHVSMKRK